MTKNSFSVPSICNILLFLATCDSGLSIVQVLLPNLLLISCGLCLHAY